MTTCHPDDQPMTPTLPTPTEELKIRLKAEEAWQRTWANAPNLTLRQAFIEGRYLALWAGIVFCRTTSKEAQQRVDRLETQLNLALTALVVAIAWGAMQ